MNDDYILVLKHKPKNPSPWLKLYQARLKAASQEAARRTEKMKGSKDRVRAMNLIVAALLRESKNAS